MRTDDLSEDERQLLVQARSAARRGLPFKAQADLLLKASLAERQVSEKLGRTFDYGLYGGITRIDNLQALLLDGELNDFPGVLWSPSVLRGLTLLRSHYSFGDPGADEKELCRRQDDLAALGRALAFRRSTRGHPLKAPALRMREKWRTRTRAIYAAMILEADRMVRLCEPYDDASAIERALAGGMQQKRLTKSLLANGCTPLDMPRLSALAAAVAEMRRGVSAHRAAIGLQRATVLFGPEDSGPLDKVGLERELGKRRAARSRRKKAKRTKTP